MKLNEFKPSIHITTIEVNCYLTFQSWRISKENYYLLGKKIYIFLLITTTYFFKVTVNILKISGWLTAVWPKSQKAS